MWTKNFHMYKRFRKGRGTREQIANVHWIREKARNSRKMSSSALLTMPKPLTVWITANCGKFFKRWEYQTTLPASWEICMQVKKQQLEPDMKQWLDGITSWMASPTRWTWIWASSGSWWWTGKPACCSPWGHRVRHDWATELNWIAQTCVTQYKSGPLFHFLSYICGTMS